MMRNPTRETRENYFAALCVHLCKESNKYIITEFILAHSHALARKGEVQFIRSHRFVNDSALAQVLSMQNASIPTSRAYDYIVNQCGEFEFVGFTAKDLFNKLDDER
ncbi:hypothetical protein M0R45_035716 [Rubus argutus]|uniref:Uncharacterized protein n=1 Tax=Rubus argutus TaxID=59490 RepID=A0AAW1VTX7_RUBAR